MSARNRTPLQTVNRKFELLNFHYNRRFLQLIQEYRVAYNNASIGQRVREHNLNSRRLHNILQ
jgi:hypothetical protein